ncbi:hypothetical protein DFH07DRAFT_728359, partial [Mycena maculata]
WLLRLVQNQGLVPIHLVKITHRNTGAAHIVVLLPDGCYVCDCCMGLNQGLVCHHYFAAWLKIPGLPFYISLIRARWYQNPRLEVARFSAIIFRDRATSRLVQFTATSLPGSTISNPVSSSTVPMPPPTQTLPQRTVYHALQAEVRLMMNGIQTQEQLDDMHEQLGQIGSSNSISFS